MKNVNNITHRTPNLIRSVVLTMLVSTIFISPPAAYADTSWMRPGHVYDSWNADQYDPCANDGSVYPITIDDSTADPLQTNQFGIPSAIIPANCFSQNAVITNNASAPVTLTYTGGFDNGTIADYIFEWVDGWNDITLNPGDSTPQFTFSVGMPWDVPNAGQGLAGKFWYEWGLKNSGSTPIPPVAVNDGSVDPKSPNAIVAQYQTPIEIDVVANDTANGATLMSVAGDGGAWAIVGGKVRFAPKDGFSGLARATYTITNADGSSSAEIFVTVLADGGTIGAPGTGVGKTGDSFSAYPAIITAGLVASVLVIIAHKGISRKRFGS